MSHKNEFESEVFMTIQRIREKGEEKELEWFWNLLEKHFSMEYLCTQTPEVIVLGADIPMEIVQAFSEKPFYILGGSLEAVHWADEKTPRDMDHVSLSTLGWLMNPHFDLTKKALVITTSASDSRRKMASILREQGKNVVVLDLYPDNDDSAAAYHYQKQLDKLVHELEKHTRTELSGKCLRRESKTIRQSKAVWEQYRNMIEKQSYPMSCEITAVLMQSMYYAEDLNEWNWHMQMLVSEMRKKAEKYYRREMSPGIMIAGSPIYFPNLKILQLIEEAGIEVRCVADAFTTQFEAIPRRVYKTETVEQALKRIAGWQVKNDASGSRVRNAALIRKIRTENDEYQVEGILAHILKGQIEYDFELSEIEMLADGWDVPVFRLETDYQYQDVEQLRIRIEAFGEMLRQRRQVERQAL